MQVLSPRVIVDLNNLPGFPPRPSGPTPQPGQFILGEYLREIHARPAVAIVGDLPATGNEVGDVRIVVAAQTWYFWTGVNWIPIAGGGGGGANPEITGQVTAGLVTGEVCYLSAVDTWTRAQADGLLIQATSLGVFAGTAGTIALSGSVITDLRCTTAGGAPAVNDKLYLAPASEDGGTAAGKVTATAPVPPGGGSVQLQVVGVCVDPTNYAGAKTVKAIFQPTYPIVLIG